VLLTQEYPDYEVIVINDGSTDESDDVLRRLEQQYGNLHHTYIPGGVKYLSRKKLALTVGIKASKNEVLLFTEANCKPLGQYWIASMAGRYKPETQLVLGFCAYGTHKGFFHKLIAYDNLLDGLRYLSSAMANRPYTGNGRNLSYLKPLFFSHKGYCKSLNLHAGDDDLFVNECARGANTEVVYTSHSITEMKEIDRFKVWKEMKVSQAATRQYYKGRRIGFFHMEDFSFLVFTLSAIASVVTGLFGNWTLALFASLLYMLRYAVKAVVWHKSSLLLRQAPSSTSLWLLEILSPLFGLYVRVYRLFRGKNDYTFHLE
jgi:glycosyltransferase involved in cell wall biosynthesis